MSLIVGLSCTDQFVILSSDSRVTSQTYLNDYDNVIGDIVNRGTVNRPKVIILTSKVLLALGGIVETGDAVFAELQQRVRPDDDLQKCSEVLAEVVDELWEQRVPQNPFLPHANRREASLNFLKTKNFGCYMMGFFEDGTTGTAYYEPESMSVEIGNSEPCRAIIFSPDEQANVDYKRWLNLSPEEHSLTNFAEQFMLLHGKLSYENQVSISPDCNFIAIMKDGSGNLQLIEETLDTEELYPMFEENPQIDHRKLWRLP